MIRLIHFSDIHFDRPFELIKTDDFAARYAELKKTWAENSTIILTLPMPVTVIPAPAGAPLAAVRRGPILLVQDSRLGEVNTPIEIPAGTPEKIEVEGIEDVYRWNNGLLLCDYASAGNLFCEENTLCVWMKKK